MSPSKDQSRATEAFHFAKLALFNVRLLNDIQNAAKHHSEVTRIIEARAKDDNIGLPVSLIHQATFLQFGYLCIVWLWEVSKAESASKQIIDEAAKHFDFNVAFKSKVGERSIDCPEKVVRLIRNAISHARVVAEDDRFIFSDQNTNCEGSPTSIRLTWPEFAQLSQAILFSVNSWLYPGDGRANP